MFYINTAQVLSLPKHVTFNQTLFFTEQIKVSRTLFLIDSNYGQIRKKIRIKAIKTIHN